MLVIQYQGQQVRIELLNNSFVNRWAEHLHYMLGLYSKRVYFSQYPYVWRYNKSQVDSYALKLSQTVKQLRDLGTGFPEDFNVSEADTQDKLNLLLQQKLNRLHRYFTTCNRDTLPFATEWAPGVPVTGLINESIKMQVFELSHQVNVQVHNLENFVETPNKKLYLDNPRRVALSVDFSMYRNNESTEESSQISKGAWHYMTPEELQWVSDDPDLDVWLPDNILGKPYNVAFYDHDDPTAWDITHNLGYTGSFSVGLIGNKASEMQTPEITQWLKSYNIDPGPLTCGMPIGRIVQGRDVAVEWYRHLHKMNFNEIEILLT